MPHNLAAAKNSSRVAKGLNLVQFVTDVNRSPFVTKPPKRLNSCSTSCGVRTEVGSSG